MYFKAMLNGVNRRSPSNTHQFPGWDLGKVISFLNTTRDNSVLLRVLIRLRMVNYTSNFVV